MDVLEIIAMLRKRQGKRTQAELAKEIGVTPTYLSDIFLGRRPPAKKILGYLGIELTYRRKK